MSRRILYVSQQLPWPKHSGGNIRAFHMLQALAKRHEVVLCSSSDGSALAREGEKIFGEMCTETRIVADPKQVSAFGQAKGVIKSLLSGESAVLEHNRSAALSAAVQGVLAEGGIDSMFLSQLDATMSVDFATSPPVVIDTQNLLYEYYARRAEIESGVLRRWVCRREARMLRAFELEVFGRAARTVVCSETEREQLHQLDSKLQVEVVPNGVDLDSMPAPDFERDVDSRELVFVGDLAYGPNQDAALHFIRDVLPLVQAREPRAKFLAVGRNPSEELVAIGKEREDVIVTGFVDDVAEWIDRAELYVVPIRYGGGTRLKVLEAFAFGKPTISTSVGAEGIDYNEGQDILIRDEPRAMADAILQLFEDRELAKRLAIAARRTAEERYGWDQLGERMADIHEQL